MLEHFIKKCFCFGSVKINNIIANKEDIKAILKDINNIKSYIINNNKIEINTI